MLIVAAIVGIWALSLCSLALTLPPEFFSSTERNDATERQRVTAPPAAHVADTDQ
jgi:hypothetical protein